MSSHEHEKNEESHEPISESEIGHVEKSEKIMEIDIEFGIKEIKHFYEFYLFVYAFKTKSEYENYKKASEKEDITFNESILPNKNLLLKDLKRKLTYEEYLEIIDTQRDTAPNIVNEIFQTIQKKEFMEYYKEFEGFGICVLSGIKDVAITKLQWICGFGKENSSLPEAIVVTEPNGEPAVQVTINNPENIQDGIVIDEETGENINIPHNQLIINGKKIINFRLLPKLSKKQKLKLILRNKLNQTTPRISIRTTDMQTNADYINSPKQSDTTSYMYEKVAKEKDKCIHEINQLIEKLEKLNPEYGDFWDKKQKSEEMKKVIQEFKKISSILIDKNKKESIERYLNQYEQFAIGLENIKGDTANKYNGYTNNFINGIKILINRIQK